MNDDVETLVYNVLCAKDSHFVSFVFCALKPVSFYTFLYFFLNSIMGKGIQDDV